MKKHPDDVDPQHYVDALRKPVQRFYLQPTTTFPEGAPDRAEYDSDDAHVEACTVYDAEWRALYLCCDTDCKNRDCPQHYPVLKR